MSKRAAVGCFWAKKIADRATGEYLDAKKR